MAIPQIAPGQTFATTPAAGAMAGMAIFDTIFGIYSAVEQSESYDTAAAESERIGRENAAAIEAETQERMRRTRLEQTASASTAKARMAASGVVDGSMGNAIGVMETENARQLAWMKTAGESQARSAVTTGAYAGATARAKASSTMANGISRGITQGVEAYKFGKKHTNWWD